MINKSQNSKLNAPPFQSNPMKKTALLVLTVLATLGLSSCSLSDLTGASSNTELTKAAAFGTCVVGCYEKVYGGTTAPDEIPITLE